MKRFDSLLIYAYGGPESMGEVPDFLASVAHGKQITRERLNEVLAHYGHFDGVSPMNGSIRKFMTRWRESVPEIPVYFGCRHAIAAPLKETVRQMILDGRKRVLVFIPAPFNGYRETYLERLAEVRNELLLEISSACSCSMDYPMDNGSGSGRGHDSAASAGAERGKRSCFPAEAVLPEFEIFPAFSTDARFLRAQEKVISAALEQLPESCRKKAVLVCSVHSLPIPAARKSGYDKEAEETVHMLRKRFPENKVILAWQSASTSRVPWLRPDVLESLREIGAEWSKNSGGNADETVGMNSGSSVNEGGEAREDCRYPVLLIPLGFPFSNMEVAYDLEVEGRNLAKELGLFPISVPTIEKEAEFIEMIRSGI
ncbi:MAG: hypothetical protein E7028_03390 [Planctomycetaceae bacterium]|nr:hypothetical protein [Planctomycetaceae bacterium]